MFLFPGVPWLKAGLGYIQVIPTAWSELRWDFVIINTTSCVSF